MAGSKKNIENVGDSVHDVNVAAANMIVNKAMYTLQPTLDMIGDIVEDRYNAMMLLQSYCDKISKVHLKNRVIEVNGSLDFSGGNFFKYIPADNKEGVCFLNLRDVVFFECIPGTENEEKEVDMGGMAE